MGRPASAPVLALALLLALALGCMASRTMRSSPHVAPQGSSGGTEEGAPSPLSREQLVAQGQRTALLQSLTASLQQPRPQESSAYLIFSAPSEPLQPSGGSQGVAAAGAGDGQQQQADVGSSGMLTSLLHALRACCWLPRKQDADVAPAVTAATGSPDPGHSLLSLLSQPLCADSYWAQLAASLAGASSPLLPSCKRGVSTAPAAQTADLTTTPSTTSGPSAAGIAAGPLPLPAGYQQKGPQRTLLQQPPQLPTGKGGPLGGPGSGAAPGPLPNIPVDSVNVPGRSGRSGRSGRKASCNG